ncbi:kynureninase, partial [Psychrobacter sanguinis]|uniref:kynureninase n=1 Tax=Psychrobacter sanguinis TaxID=861445 RepID=UPI00289A4C27
MIRLFALSIALMALAGCSGDPNSKLEYGDSGYPSNCRAYIQESVDDWRNGVHSTEDTMDA